LLLTLWLGSAPWQFAARADLVGIGIAAVVVQVMKLLVRRPRPPGEWGQGYRRLDPHSFPSGHAARAIMLATMSMFLGPAWWAVLLLAWAPLVALSRVALRVHYLSDVVVGTVCGLICGVALGLLLAF
jgi:undecaprenyl-diphosphatase